MYQCSGCKTITPANQGQVRVILETRQKDYKNEIRLEKGFKVKETKGWEIVKEAAVCVACAKTKYAGKDYNSVQARLSVAK